MAFVICPNCGTSVEDTALRCPACHADISATTRMPRQASRWCRGCGAIIAEGLAVCPACGLPVAGGPADAAPAPNESPAPAGPADLTRAIPRIESALPLDPADAQAGQGIDMLPRPPQVISFVLAAAAVVILVAVLITHPWDPDAHSIKATTEADTSKVGFPGEMDALSSQDRSAIAAEAAEAETDAREAATAALGSAWDELGALREALATNEALARSTVDGAVARQDAKVGAAQAQATSLSLSNLIASVDAMDPPTNELAEAREHMVTLGNWLRNWSDAIVETWDAIVDAGYAADADALAALDEAVGADGRNAYQALFDGSYQLWEPPEH